MEKDEKLDILNMPESEVPAVINEKFDQLAEIKSEIQDLQSSSIEIKNNALIVKNKKVGIFNKKNAIKDLQTLTVDISNNQVANAEITNKILMYQQKIAETMKFLLGLGVTNLATNRAVVKQLKDRLESAQNGSIDEYEEKEILSVLRQLKAQEDILEKQERMGKRFNELNDKICKIEKENISLTESLTIANYKIKKLNKLIIILMAVTGIIALASLIISILAIM